MKILPRRAISRGTKKRSHIAKAWMSDVGYRYYDTVGIPVLFPFGHGLHYAAFEYNNLELTIQRDEATSKRDEATSKEISNTGNRSFSKPAMEGVQLYIKPIGSSVYQPCHELKGFSKVEIAPGSNQTVELVLDERSFSYYDTMILDGRIGSWRRQEASR
jgi:beta-glucosidase